MSWDGHKGAIGHQGEAESLPKKVALIDLRNKFYSDFVKITDYDLEAADRATDFIDKYIADLK